MKKTNILLAGGSLALGLMGSASAASISIADAPTTGIIAQNTSGTTTGNRELSWRTADIHSQTGQSFKVVGSGAYSLDSIYLYQNSSETYGNWASTSYSVKVFAGTATDANAALATFDYDATGLSDDGVATTAATWLQFSSDAVVNLTAGVQYSFLIANGSLDSDHRVNFLRDQLDVYADGGELRPAANGNSYDISGWDTDPWDVSAPQNPGGPVTELGDSELHFYVTGTAVPEPSSTALLGLAGFAFMLRRRR